LLRIIHLLLSVVLLSAFYSDKNHDPFDDLTCHFVQSYDDQSLECLEGEAKCDLKEKNEAELNALVPCALLSFTPTPFTEITTDPQTYINPASIECGTSTHVLSFAFTIIQFAPFMIINPGAMDVEWSWDGPPEIDLPSFPGGGIITAAEAATIPPGSYVLTFCYTDPDDGIECCANLDFEVTGPTPTITVSETVDVCVDELVTISASNEGGVYNWDVDGADGTVGPDFGPYDISWDAPGTYTVSMILEDGDCTAAEVSQEVNVIVCDVDCEILTADVTNIVCDNAGTPSDDSDDTFTFNLEVTGNNTGAGWTSDLTGTPGGAYGTPVSMGPFPITGGTFSFTVTDDDDNTCDIVVSFEQPMTCSTQCSISATYDNVQCNDAGTPADPTDDTFTFDIFVSGSNIGSGWTGDDVNSSSGLYGATTNLGPYDISAGDFTITLSDDTDSGCTFMLNIEAPEPCSDLCTISATVTNVTCDDNGTGSDPSDDVFFFDIEVTGLNIGSSWNASDPNSSSGIYDAVLQLGPYDISAGDLSFTITDDDDISCTFLVDVTAPPSCSDACNILETVTNVLCDDNGTPSDPSDDTFSFDIEVTGLNTGASWFANDILGSSGLYDQTINLGPYNISDGDLNFVVTDIDDAGCTEAFIVPAPATCSDACEISGTVSNVVCDDNNTDTDPSDDTFTFDLLMDGVNIGTTWTANDPNNSSGSYGSTINLGPYPISGGDLSFLVEDGDDNTCTFLVEVEAPAPCSDACEIDVVVTNIVCNNAGTPADDSDDVFSFDILVTGTNTGTSWTADDPNGMSGSYNSTISMGPYPISGGNFNFTVTDDDDGSCTFNVDFEEPMTCSTQCSISSLISNVSCDDNGTPSDPSDDVFFFDIIVSGMNTGSGWNGDDILGSSGLYGATVNLGPYQISDGDLNFNIIDNVDGSCTTNIMVSAPATCSDDCEITNADVTDILCDDNGTPTDPSDDTFTFNVFVDGLNIGSSWTASDPNGTTGSYGSLIGFGPYDISNGDLLFTITDANDGSCTFLLNVAVPSTCSDECEIISAVVDNVLCNDEGTPSDPSDDTFTFDLLVTSNNGTTWTANDVLSSTGSYGVIENLGPYLISDGNLNFFVIDDADATCDIQVIVTAPDDCSQECEIVADVTDVMCDNNGTPSDPSDDTFSFMVNVNGNNIGSSWNATDPNTTSGSYGAPVLFGPYDISGGDLNFSIQDGLDNLCSTILVVPAPNTCSDDCDIDFTFTNVVCDDNGTPADDTDDTYTFDVIVTGNNIGASWTANDANNTTGTYGNTVTFGPYLIASGNQNFNITDIDDLNCSVVVSVLAPSPCSTQCSLSNLVSDIICNDSGTPSDPSDDTFSFVVIVSGSNTGAAWTADDINNTSGAYDVGISFGPFDISAGIVNFVVTDDVDSGCTTTVSVMPPAPCSNDCEIAEVIIDNITCDDAGTGSDASDDTFTFDVIVNGSNVGSSWVANDPLNSSGSYGVTLTMGPYLISGGMLSFDIMDILDLTCTFSVDVIPPATCSDECSIVMDISNILCDDNGTPSDPSDDTFTFVGLATGNNAGSGWSADDPLSTSGMYGSNTTFGPYQISNGDLSFTATDNSDPSCSVSVFVEAPETCSDLCDISQTILDVICDDEGTPSDPSDDTYTFTVMVSGVNTSSNWVSSDPNSTIGNYDVPVIFGPYLIAGGDLSFTISDGNDGTCTVAVSVEAPESCSDECDIDFVVSNILCNNNGTTTDDADDTYTFDIVVSGVNTGSGWTASDPNSTSGSYDAVVSFGPYDIASGNQSFTITDDSNNTCTVSVVVTAPNACSTQCSLSNSVSDIACNDNGTPSDPSDDTFTFNLLMTGSNLGSGWTSDDPLGSNGAYNVMVNMGPYLISNGNLNFTVTDDTDSGCTSVISVMPPEPCSDMCEIDVEITNVECDDNGTGSDVTDDTFTFDMLVNGLNVGSSWMANDPNTASGSYGNVITMGNYPIVSGNTLSFVVNDALDPTCTFSVDVPHPSPCSVACGIETTLATILCDDNGTLTDSSDDTYTFILLVDGLDPSMTWTANDAGNTSGNYGTPQLFGPFPIGMDINLVITDDLDNTCSITEIITSPEPCSSSCEIESTVTNIQCDDNGTPNDSSDDTFTFTVTASGSNVGSSWVSTDPNSTTGNYDVPVVFGPYLISNGDLTFTITDSDDGTCSDALNVTAPPACSDACSIDFVISNLNCNDNGTMSDDSDDTYTFDLIATGTNAGTTWTATDPNGTTGSYGVATTFGPYNISGGNLNFTLSDDSNNTCTVDVEVIAPLPCSDACSIDFVISNISCNDNGTVTDDSDDTYTFDLIATGTNAGTTWTATDANATTGSYGVLVTFGPYSISGGNQNFIITDDLNNTCTIDVEVIAPSACSTSCSLSNIVSNITCSDNGTPSDATDDTFNFDLLMTGSNLGTGWSANDPLSSMGSYDVVSNIGPFLISGGDLMFTVTDNDDMNCTSVVTVVAPAACSNACEISTMISNVVCDDNGTSADSSDDTFTFDILVNGVNIGSSWTANDPNASSGSYGNIITMGPYPIVAAATLSFVVTDAIDPNCASSVDVPHPASCSAACGITAMSSNIECNDNGTPSDASDDTYTFSLLVDGLDPSLTWTADDGSSTSGNYGTTEMFGPFPIGTDITLVITDDTDNSCTTSIMITSPLPCSALNCDIGIVVGDFTCDDNGTPGDNSDDTFEVDITITGTGSGWTADDPNSTIGTFSQTTVFGPYTATASPFVLTIINDDDVSCSEQVSIEVPASCFDAEEDCTNAVATPCDDGDLCTINDMETILSDGTECIPCMGEPVDCGTDGTCEMIVDCGLNDPCLIPGIEVILISDGSVCVPCTAQAVDCSNGESSLMPCDDGDPNTVEDMMVVLDCTGEICEPCMGIPADCLDDDATITQSCDDGDPCTEDDIETVLISDGAICIPCEGILMDCSNGETVTQACDDGDPSTLNDMETILTCSGEICEPCMGMPDPNIQVSNVIWTNSSQGNDGWAVYFPEADITIEQLSIYDRWGNLVHEIKNQVVDDQHEILWDARYNGQAVNPGVFVYMMRIVTVEGNVMDKGGSITVIR